MVIDGQHSFVTSKIGQHHVTVSVRDQMAMPIVRRTHKNQRDHGECFHLMESVTGKPSMISEKSQARANSPFKVF
jgi:hypothetical protein